MPSAEKKCGNAFTIEPLATGLIYNAKKIDPQTWRHPTPVAGEHELLAVFDLTADHFPPQQQSNNAWQSMRCWIRSRLISRSLR